MRRSHAAWESEMRCGFEFVLSVPQRGHMQSGFGVHFEKLLGQFLEVGQRHSHRGGTRAWGYGGVAC